MEFWKVNDPPIPPSTSDTFFIAFFIPLAARDIEQGGCWIRNHPEIQQVALRVSAVEPVYNIVEGSWDVQRVHILITADALEEWL